MLFTQYKHQFYVPPRSVHRDEIITFKDGHSVLMYFWVGTDWSCSAYTDHLNIPKFTGNGFVNGLSFYRPQMECQNP